MSVDLAEPLMTGEYRLLDLEAGHWLIQDRYDTIAAEVVAHLGAHRLSG
jgi:hypothetical protein